VYSYAVMSNHTHIVLHVNPSETQAWSDEQVARRWLAVFPGALRDAQSDEQKEYIALALRSDPERMKEAENRMRNPDQRSTLLNTDDDPRFSAITPVRPEKRTVSLRLRFHP
jgi:hypothetical protein